MKAFNDGSMARRDGLCKHESDQITAHISQLTQPHERCIDEVRQGSAIRPRRLCKNAFVVEGNCVIRCHRFLHPNFKQFVFLVKSSS